MPGANLVSTGLLAYALPVVQCPIPGLQDTLKSLDHGFTVLAADSTQLLKELETCLGSLPILSSKCQTSLGERQAGSANVECRRQKHRIAWCLMLHSDSFNPGLRAIL